jgi:hypothetical protein
VTTALPARDRHVPPLPAIALVSAAAVAAQILLLRLFAIVQWHHYAYLVISLALLGYGAAGTFVTLAQRWLLRHPGRSMALAMAGFGISCVPVFLLAQQANFSPEEMLWRPVLALRLTVMYVLLAVPFFFAATAIALSLRIWPGRAGRIYAADLTGAGTGGLLALVSLAWLQPLAGLVLAGLTGLAAAALVAAGRGDRRPGPAEAVVLCLGLLAASSAFLVDVRPSPYKDLSQALLAAGARVELERPGALGTVSVVDSPVVPPRYAPGLSLLAPGGPPDQKAVFINGDVLGALSKDGPEGGVFTRWLPTALPWHLAPAGRVFIADPGAGLPVLQALAHGATDVRAADARAGLVEVVARDYGEWTGDLFRRPGVSVRPVDPRAFLARSRDPFDLIVLPPAGALGGTGLQALAEDHLLTREQIPRLLQHLGPGGMLAAACWIDLPARTCPRLAATLLAGLEAFGVTEPAAHLLGLRAWQLAVLVVSADPWPDDAVVRLKTFAEERAFDLVWYPGMQRIEANRINQMAAPYLFDAIAALAGPRRDAFLSEYPFDIRPVADDRPFATSFLKLTSFDELQQLAASGAVALIDAGPVLLLVALVQSLLAGAVLVLLPLATGRRSGGQRLGMRGALYFASIGLGFMLLEIALLHRLSLLLADPVRSAAIVIAGMLVTAGIGSSLSRPLAARLGSVRLIRLAVLGITAAVLVLVWVLPSLTAAAAGWPLPGRMVLALALVAPVALLLGVMLPTGLSRLAADTGGDAVPWAWAVNGCASVTGAVLATLVALTAGFSVCMLIALGCYAVAAGFPPGAVQETAA